MDTVTFFHTANAGDVIATMAGLRNHYNKTLKEDKPEKSIFYQKLYHFAKYYEGAVHPTRDKNNTMVTMNDHIFDMLRPLVMAQPYMEDFVKWDNQKYLVDLSRIHDGVKINMPWGQIQRWTWYPFPDLAIGGDLADPWINVPYNPDITVGVNGRNTRDLSKSLIINFTSRYRNHQINYSFLRKYQDSLIFAGVEEEHKDFTDRWKLKIPYLRINDFLELAQAIKQSAGFLGNASMCWNIAEAMKVPRILEYCHYAPNCLPIGGDYALDFQFQGAVELYVDELLRVAGKKAKETMNCPVCDRENESVGIKKGYHYHYCKSCGTLYCKHIDQSGMLGGIQTSATEERSLENKGRILRIKNFMPGVNKLLDFGCGTEELVNAAKEAGMQAFGYDKYSTDNNILPVGMPFDCVTMVEVAEHLSYPFEEFDEVFDQLRPGGFLYLETSFSDWVGINDDYCDPEKGHCTIFSQVALKQLLESKDFKCAGYANRNTWLFEKPIQ